MRRRNSRCCMERIELAPGYEPRPFGILRLQYRPSRPCVSCALTPSPTTFGPHGQPTRSLPNAA